MNWNTLSRRSRYILAVLSGILLGLSFPPTGIAGSLLAFVALVPLLIALDGAEGFGRTFRIGFVSMFVLGIVANYWVGGWKSIGEADPFLMLGGVLLALVHPFFLVIPWLLYDFTRRRFGRRTPLYSLPIFYAGFEYWHSFGDLSYSWLSLYNTQSYNLSFIQFIELTGPFVLSALIALINVEIFEVLRSRARERTVHLAALLALVIVPYLHGMSVIDSREASSASLRVTVEQPNIDPWAKWQVDAERILDTNFSVTRQALAEVHDSTDLLIWPETAITFFITTPGRERELRAFDNFLISIHHPILTGFPDREEYLAGRDSIPKDANPERSPGWYYRSWNAAMLDYETPYGAIVRERYHKQKLVPLGEHVPFVDLFPFVGKLFQWGVGLGSWNYGSGYAPLRMPLDSGKGSLRVSPLICYESVYPSFVRHFVEHGANMLAIITNDGWYGRSSGPYQHDQFAVLRAIENRRWIARSANTGISTFIDDRGRFVQSLPLFVSGSITQRIPLIERKTFYTRYGDFFAIPCLIYASLMTAYGLFVFVRRKSTRGAGLWPVTPET